MNLGQAQVRKTYWVPEYWAACSNTKNQQILLCLFLQLCLRLTLHLFNKRSLQDRIAFSEHKHHPRFHTWARPKFILLAPWRDDLRTFCHMLFLQSSSSSLVCCVYRKPNQKREREPFQHQWATSTAYFHFFATGRVHLITSGRNLVGWYLFRCQLLLAFRNG